MKHNLVEVFVDDSGTRVAFPKHKSELFRFRKVPALFALIYLTDLIFSFSSYALYSRTMEVIVEHTMFFLLTDYLYTGWPFEARLLFSI